jgi:hypothetical protein
MKQITITVDTAKWEDFDRGEKIINPNRNTMDDIIECLQDCVGIEKESSKPQLRIVGREENTEEIKQDISNITRIGPPSTESEIKIDIEDKLFEDIVWAAKRRNMSSKELTEKWITDYMDICKPEMSDVTRAIYAGLGLEIMELVK